MDKNLQRLCETQLENEENVRNCKNMRSEDFVKLGALLFTSNGIKPDIEKIQSCREIFKQKTKKVSEFEELESIIIIKMSMAQDPESYIDGAVSVYNKIIEGKIFTSVCYAVTAITIYEHCLANGMDTDAVIAKTFSDFKKLAKGNPFEDEWNMYYLALMITEGIDFENSMKDIEESYKLLRKDWNFPGEIAKPTALLLTFSSKTVEDKVNILGNLFEALKKQKCNISSSKATAIYAMFVDLDEDRDTLVNNIAEVSEYFKDKKNYGMLSTSDVLRKGIAASLVLQNCEKSDSDQSVSIISAVVVEELISMLAAAIILLF